MNPEEIKALIEAGFDDAQVEVSGDGYKNEATIISSAFAGLSTLKRHQLVYKTINEAITSGALHAITLKTKTPEEAAQA